jgi:hypothetical protein
LKGENNTLSWLFKGNNITNIIILANGSQFLAEQNGTEVTVSLRSLTIGLYNFSFVLENGNEIYKDLVWVQILKNEANLVTDVFIPFGTGIFVMAIGIVIIFHLKRRSKSII